MGTGASEQKRGHEPGFVRDKYPICYVRDVTAVLFTGSAEEPWRLNDAKTVGLS